MPAADFYSADLVLQPWWWEAAPRPRLGTQPLPEAIDAAVVGSGYAGLSAALTLLRRGRGVVVLESGRVGSGASTRNGGAVGETLRLSFSAMERRYGRETALAFYLGVREARAHLEQLIAGEDIVCHYARVGRFIGAHRRQDYETLARDLERRHAAIGFEAEMIEPARLHEVVGSDAYHGGRLIHSDGNLHPGLLHQGLLDAVLAAGGQVVEQMRVEAIEKRSGGGFRVSTGGGALTCGQVIVASNGYTAGESPWLRRRLLPIQSQIIATEPLPPETVERLIPRRRQLGDTRRLHNYFRTSPDGSRILFGGRAGGGTVDDPRRSGAQLRRQMLAIFPELAEARITHSWAGFIAYTFDSLPHLASHEGIHYPAGFCGSGIAMAPYLGHKAALKALGSPEAATPFDRTHPTLPGYRGRPWFMPAVLGYFGLRDRLRC